MKLSCLPVSLFPSIVGDRISIRKWAQIGREAGLNAIDLSIVLIKNHSPVYIKKIKEELDHERMPITMITTYPDFTIPDPTQRERELEYLKRDIALSSFLEAKYVRITAGQAYPETSIDKGKEWVIEYFKKASSFAEKFKIRLLFENHSKPGVWEYPDLSHPTEIFLDIAEQIRNTGIRINFDTANTLAYGDDPLIVLEIIKTQIETIHAADTLTRGKLEPTILGQGIVPFREIFTLLKKNRFDGWICIEEASRQGIQGIITAVKFIRQCWDEVSSK